jgi:hypothetical protein
MQSESSSVSLQDLKTEKKEKSNIWDKSSSKINNINRQNDDSNTIVANQNVHKSNFTKSISDLKNKKKENSSLIHKKNINLKKHAKNNDNNNSTTKKLENISNKKLTINKVDDKQKIRATDLQPTLDSFQKQRRVNKGKIR